VGALAAPYRYGEFVETGALDALASSCWPRPTLELEWSLLGHRPRRTCELAETDGDRGRGGHRLDERRNTGEITVQLLSGRARVVAGADEVILGVGDYAVIPPEWDPFEALDDTVVLLTAAVQGQKD
jgi:hypothetical protein